MTLLTEDWNWTPGGTFWDYVSDNIETLSDRERDIGIRWPKGRPQQAVAFRLSTGEDCQGDAWQQLAIAAADGRA